MPVGLRHLVMEVENRVSSLAVWSPFSKAAFPYYRLAFLILRRIFRINDYAPDHHTNTNHCYQFLNHGQEPEGETTRHSLPRPEKNFPPQVSKRVPNMQSPPSESTFSPVPSLPGAYYQEFDWRYLSVTDLRTNLLS